MDGDEITLLLPELDVGHKKLRIVFASVLGFIGVVLAVFLIYAGIYYRASDYAGRVATESTETYTVKETDGNIVFMPKSPEAGLIFYPGGKVEYTAYAPLMARFCERNVACVLVSMPFNLAVFDINAADGIIKKYPEVKRWYIGGHSLGGSMAASYISKHAKDYDGLILLGAYSTADLKNTGLDVMSIYGSEDRVLNGEKYKKYSSNLPEGYGELVISGGCHAYFGDYGAQSGDGTPTITRESQQKQTVDFVISKILK